MRPRIRITVLPRPPRAVVLVIHGGDGDGTAPVRAWQPAVVRMRLLAAHIARRTTDVAVLRLLNRARGLGERPLADVDWALSEIGRRFPSAPIWLVGHSLGGTVALAAAGRTGVEGVVALSPWLSGQEEVDPLVGRTSLVLHGAQDTVTDPGLSCELVRRARDRGAAASLVLVRNGGHGMLRRYGTFHRLCSGFIRAASGGRCGAPRRREEHLVDRLWRTPGAGEM